VAVATIVADFGAAIFSGLSVSLDVALLVSATPVEARHHVSLDGLLAVLSPAAHSYEPFRLTA
jgi:hypothetical protein